MDNGYQMLNKSINTKIIHKKNNLTGQPSLIIPAFAIAMLSKEPPRAAMCSSPIEVMTAAASLELQIMFVASRAPPSPACFS